MIKKNMLIYYTKTQIVNRDKQDVISSLNSLLFKEENNYLPFYPFCFFSPKYYLFLKERRKSPYYGIKKNDVFEFTKYSIITRTWQIRFNVEVISEFGKTIVLLKFILSKFDLIVLVIGVSFFLSLVIFGNFEVYYLVILIISILIHVIIDIYPILRRIKKCISI